MAADALFTDADTALSAVWLDFSTGLLGAGAAAVVSEESGALSDRSEVPVSSDSV